MHGNLTTMQIKSRTIAPAVSVKAHAMLGYMPILRLCDELIGLRSLAFAHTYAILLRRTLPRNCLAAVVDMHFLEAPRSFSKLIEAYRTTEPVVPPQSALAAAPSHAWRARHRSRTSAPPLRMLKPCAAGTTRATSGTWATSSSRRPSSPGGPSGPAGWVSSGPRSSLLPADWDPHDLPRDAAWRARTAVVSYSAARAAVVSYVFCRPPDRSLVLFSRPCVWALLRTDNADSLQHGQWRSEME
jgi:hypothetical protein